MKLVIFILIITLFVYMFIENEYNPILLLMLAPTLFGINFFYEKLNKGKKE